MGFWVSWPPENSIWWFRWCSYGAKEQTIKLANTVILHNLTRRYPICLKYPIDSLIGVRGQHFALESSLFWRPPINQPGCFPNTVPTNPISRTNGYASTVDPWHLEVDLGVAGPAICQVARAENRTCPKWSRTSLRRSQLPYFRKGNSDLASGNPFWQWNMPHL